MLPAEYSWIVDEFEPEGNVPLLRELGIQFEEAGNLEGAATVFDRAYGLDPTDEGIARRRRHVLDRLAVTEHGIHFRYVPGGAFLMGSFGEPDEQPYHPVWLTPFWMAETPVSWATHCRLMSWQAPPVGMPNLPEPWDNEGWALHHGNRIRLQYCEDHTTRALDWHAHMHGQTWRSGDGREQTAEEMFGTPPRTDPQADWRYDTKPMVAVSIAEATALATRLSSPQVRYALPSEAQWEKAARGGLIGARYAWGNESPTTDRCDFGRFHDFSIQPMKTCPPNGYGLYANNGGVWEWTRDWYCSDYYSATPTHDPEGPAQGQERVLRGGSWSDCAEVVTVTFRMSRSADPSYHHTPNIGFRLCRMRATG